MDNSKTRMAMYAASPIPHTHAQTHQSFLSSSLWQPWMTAFSHTVSSSPNTQCIFDRQPLDTRGLINSSILLHLTGFSALYTMLTKQFAYVPALLGFLKLSLQTETFRGNLYNLDLWNNYHKSAMKKNPSQASPNSLLTFWVKTRTDRVQVLHDVLEGWMCPELLKELPLVEQRVHQVGVVV